MGENNGKGLGYVEESKTESWRERIVVPRKQRSENQAIAGQRNRNGMRQEAENGEKGVENRI